VLGVALVGCDQPHTTVVVDNHYPALIVYRASWQAVSFQTPILPGSSSDPQSTLAASPNAAYVLLAPGWDPQRSTPPTSFVVMQSVGGFGVNLDETLHIPVDDTTFIGNCASGSFLRQDQADFITQFVFPSDFASSSYDPKSCTTTPIGDAGGD
jgi:hypothetical protein